MSYDFANFAFAVTITVFVTWIIRKMDQRWTPPLLFLAPVTTLLIAITLANWTHWKWFNYEATKQMTQIKEKYDMWMQSALKPFLDDPPPCYRTGVNVDKIQRMRLEHKFQDCLVADVLVPVGLTLPKSNVQNKCAVPSSSTGTESTNVNPVLGYANCLLYYMWSASVAKGLFNDTFPEWVLVDLMRLYATPPILLAALAFKIYTLNGSFLYGRADKPKNRFVSTDTDKGDSKMEPLLPSPKDVIRVKVNDEGKAETVQLRLFATDKEDNQKAFVLFPRTHDLVPRLTKFFTEWFKLSALDTENLVTHVMGVFQPSEFDKNWSKPITVQELGWLLIVQQQDSLLAMPSLATDLWPIEPPFEFTSGWLYGEYLPSRGLPPRGWSYGDP